MHGENGVLTLDVLKHAEEESSTDIEQSYHMTKMAELLVLVATM